MSDETTPRFRATDPAFDGLAAAMTHELRTFMTGTSLRSGTWHPAISDKLFPVVQVDRRPIEYPRGNWGQPPRRRFVSTVKSRVRRVRRTIGRAIAGDQWPSDPWDED